MCISIILVAAVISVFDQLSFTVAFSNCNYTVENIQNLYDRRTKFHQHNAYDPIDVTKKVMKYSTYTTVDGHLSIEFRIEETTLVEHYKIYEDKIRTVKAMTSSWVGAHKYFVKCNQLIVTDDKDKTLFTVPAKILEVDTEETPPGENGFILRRYINIRKKMYLVHKQNSVKFPGVTNFEFIPTHGGHPQHQNYLMIYNEAHERLSVLITKTKVTGKYVCGVYEQRYSGTKQDEEAIIRSAFRPTLPDMDDFFCPKRD